MILGPKPLGGDRRSGRIEAHAELILSLVEEKPDMIPEKGIGAALALVPGEARHG